MSNAQAKEQKDYPELTAVLEHQKAIAALALQLKSIDSATADQEQMLAAAREQRPSADALSQRRQDLFAAEALGQVTESERAKREAEIDRDEEELNQRFASVDQSIERMVAALKGLGQRREETDNQLQGLQSLTADLLEKFLVAEAERACTAYVNAALTVKERYLQLISLSAFRTQVTQDQRKPRRFRGSDAGKFFIPSFDLPQCMGIVHPNTSGTLVSAEWLDYSGPEAAELARLRELGVTLL